MMKGFIAVGTTLPLSGSMSLTVTWKPGTGPVEAVAGTVIS